MAETYYTVVRFYHLNLLFKGLILVQDDPSLDMMSEENALKTLPCWLGSVLKALWQDRWLSALAK